MRTIVLIFMLFTTVLSYAEELKLQCDLKIDREYRDGTQEHESTIAIVAVIENPNRLSIYVDNAEPLLTVSSRVSGRVISVTNNSDRNKWELRNESVDSKPGEPNTTRSIRIDRNTGMLAYREVFRNGRITSTGSGYCTKVNDTVRKF